MPEYRLKVLEEVFSETYFWLRCGVEEGLILHDEAKEAEEQLRSTRALLNSLRAEVVCAGEWWRQYFAAFRGLSRKISALEHKVRALRAHIVATSEEGRAKLEENGESYNPCMIPLASDVKNPAASSTWSWRSLTHAGLSNDSVAGARLERVVIVELDPPANHLTPFALHHDLRITRGHRDSTSSVATSVTAVDLEAHCEPPITKHHRSDNACYVSPCKYQGAAEPSSILKTYSMGPFVEEPDIASNINVAVNDRHTLSTMSKREVVLEELTLSSLQLKDQLVSRNSMVEMDISDGIDDIDLVRPLSNAPSLSG